MNVYFDASALTAVLLRDERAEAVEALLHNPYLVASLSDFGFGELTSAIARRVRGRALSRARGQRAIERAASAFQSWRSEAVTSADIADATNMLGDFDLNLRLPDAIHLAIARRLSASLVTLDKDQAKAAAALGIDHIDPTSP